jgi:hypothetical protein
MSTPLLLRGIKQYKEEVTCNSGTRREHTTLEGGTTTHNVHNEININKTKAYNM